MSNKQEIVELLTRAYEQIYEAVNTLQTAQSLMEDEEGYSYNITGNMDGYVINYLTGGTDSIVEKIKTYIEETEELEEMTDDELHEDEDDYEENENDDPGYVREPTDY